jgi:nitrogenase molybdenum-iron protein alpha chain
MSYYDQKVPPVRDHRLQLADSFSGTACDLLNCQKEGCLMQKNRSFWQSGACQMSLTLMMAATVQNSVIVMHSPGGCGAGLQQQMLVSNRGRVQRGLPPSTGNWISTDLREADVIGGGENKLREAILYADREFRPEIIFVVSTCAPNIIGDDVAEVVKQAQNHVAAQVVSLHCPGFKSRVVASAYDAFYHGLLRDVPFEPEPWKDYVPLDPSNPKYDMEQAKERYKKSRTVNLWNATSIGAQDEAEIVRLLGAIGLRVRVFAEFSSLDEFRLVTQAALNVSMCNVHDDYILTYLKEKYDMPYYIAGMPIGFAGTRRWLCGIAAHFGLEAEAQRLADYEEQIAAEAIAPYLPKVKGKRVLICGGVVRVGVEAVALAEELGMDVLSIKAYHYDDNAESVFADVADKLPQTHVAVSNQIFELTHQVKTLKPDIVITHNGTHGPMAKLGVPSVQLFSNEGAFFAYNGFYQILRKIDFALTNNNYQKRLVEHIKQPYKDWYWKADTYAFLKE